MNKTDISRLYNYSYWATALILNTAEGLTDEQYMAEIPGISHGSTHATLAHMLGAESIWRQRCFEGVSPTKLLSAQDFADLDSLRAFWEVEELKMRVSLDLLTDYDLDQVIEYSSTGGRGSAFRLGEILQHLLIHGVQHRSEAAAALTSLGHSPGDVDIIKFYRL